MKMGHFKLSINYVNLEGKSKALKPIFQQDEDITK